MSEERSRERYGQALSMFPGGVNSSVRALRPFPFFVDRGEGAHVVDVDGNRYLDYVMGYGPLLLGHTLPEAIQDRIAAQVADGPMYGAPAEPAMELAAFIIDHVASVEKLRFTNSGTEATTTAVRLARGYTGRDRIVIVGGGYHGAQDTTLVSGDHGRPAHPKYAGVPPRTAADTIIVPFNDAGALESVFERYGDEIAGVMVEPLLGNTGLVHPIDGYLQAVRDITREHGALFILDEVMTGFRIGGLSCAQGVYGIEPDLTTFAKVIGGGFPVAALGGRSRIMNQLTPSGDVFHSSTYAAHPVGMVAGVEMLRYAADNGVYEELTSLGDRLRAGLSDVLEDRAPQYTVVGRDSMFKIVFSDARGQPAAGCKAGCRQDASCDRYDTCPKSAADISAADGDRWERLLWPAMKDEGIVLTANQDESQFLSDAHTEADIERTIDAYDTVLASIA